MSCDNDRESMCKGNLTKAMIIRKSQNNSADDLGRSSYGTNFHNASF